MEKEASASSLKAGLQDAVESGARLGAVVVEAGAERVAIDPDGRYPLASVRKVVTLGGYALTVASRACDPAEWVPLRDVDRWHWPGTDGGAHDRARSWWGETGALRRPGSDETVSLGALALAMMRFSDNAAADYLLHRIGPEAATTFARQMGLATQDPILPLLGEFRAWHRSPETWVTMTPAGRAQAAWDMAQGEHSPFDTVPVDEATQRRCAAVGCRGTPREWARLMAGLADGMVLPAAPRRIVREALERPASGPGDDGRFGAKAGDLPGVLTFAGYVRTRTSGAPEVAVAMFLIGLAPEPLHWLSQMLPRTPSQLRELSGVLEAIV